MRIKFRPIVASHCLVMCLLLAACVDISQRLTYSSWLLLPVSIYHSGYQKGTEIISVQSSSLKAMLSNSETGEVDVLDISHPEHISRIARFNLGLTQGQELTSVAYHPSLNLFAVVIDNGLNPGKLEIRSAINGKLEEQAVVGYGADAVIFSKDGNFALIANEGEDYGFNPVDKTFYSPKGSVSLINFDDTGHILSNDMIKLSDLTEQKQFELGEGRYLERPIDWNGDGKISKAIDFNGDGQISDTQAILGKFHGRDVIGREQKGEKEILIPLTLSPDSLEPEFIALAPNQKTAYVTLQENNLVAVIDLGQKKITDYVNLGTIQHAADLTHDGAVNFSEKLTALREPDGIVTTTDGRYFVTADEGDSEIISLDKASSSVITYSGGRSVSIFDATTGKLAGDTGNQLDEMAFSQHVYSDKHSDKKGSEPEMLTSFDMNNVPLVAVNLDEAGVIELISMSDPTKPKVIALGRFPDTNKKAPEGIAHFQIKNKHYLLTANEKNGTVECYQVVNK